MRLGRQMTQSTRHREEDYFFDVSDPGSAVSAMPKPATSSSIGT